MPQFSYKAKSGPGEITTGVIDANSLQEAVQHIIAQGIAPVDVKPFIQAAKPVPEKSRAPIAFKLNLSFEQKISPKALHNFIRQLADLLDAGVPLLRAMQVIANQQMTPRLKEIVEQMAEVIKDGGSLSTAMSHHPKVFNNLFIYMVKSGEASGSLANILIRLTQFLEKDLEMGAKVKGALLYPAIVMGVGLLTVFVLLTFVLPKMMTMFEDFDQTLPWATQFVMALSSFCSSFWWLIILILAVLIIGARQFLQSTKGKDQLDGLMLRLPIMKDFMREVELARFARTLGTLLDSGVTMVTALESSANVINNNILKREMEKAAAKVKSGGSLSGALKNNPWVGEMAVNFISIGEESGKLEKGLYKLAVNCDRQTEELSQVFVTLLGPLVLVVVVGIVGFLVVSMLLPMFQMNSMIN